MTNTTPGGEHLEDLFPPEDLLRPEDDDTALPPPSDRRWALPTALLMLAAVALLAAFFLNDTSSSAQPLPAETTTPTPQPAASPPGADSPTSAAVSQQQPGPTVTDPPERPISELADPAWVSETAAIAGIPEAAMAAYAGAAIRADEKYPGCNLGWNTLAAVGFVESEHGTFGGSRIGTDGVVDPPIIGVPLNGNGVQAVPDTDDGELDGDRTWDRAVGPMQFIPSTWRANAQDGNLDGVADIHNIEDAAATAASVLCLTGGDLSNPSNWIAALHAYNPSVPYNNRVATTADYYAGIG